MLNVCALIGNLGADPEIFYSSEGKPVATFNLAFKSSKTKTGWIKITAFNKLAGIVENHLHRGARIAVVGVLDYQTWQTDKGETRSSYQIIAETLEFIKTDGRGTANESTEH
jgi:single-strand DNA-binding protein